MAGIQIGKVFSPYVTDSYQRCPALWDKSRRVQLVSQKKYTAMLIGSAVALGLERHYKGFPDGQEKAEELVEAQYQEGSDRTLRGVKNLTKQGIELGMATNLGVTKIEAVEQFFGNIKPDLVAREKDELVVIDHKVKVNLKDEYLEKELQTFDCGNQMLHYAWAVGAEYGEPVERVYIHMIVLAPAPKTLLHPVKMTSERIQLWLQGVAKDWVEMEAITKRQGIAGTRFSSCIGKYGPCDMYELCHSFNGDEQAALTSGLYEPVAKRW